MLGTFFSGCFFAFHLLHIAQGNDILNRAISSVTTKWVSLMYVSVGGIFIVYCFSVISFIFFRVDYSPDDGRSCRSSPFPHCNAALWHALTHPRPQQQMHMCP